MLEEAKEEEPVVREPSNFEVEGSQEFKNLVNSALASLPSYPLTKLKDGNIRIEEGEEISVTFSEKGITISFPVTLKGVDWNFAFRVALGIAFDRLFGGDTFSSLKSPAMKNSINAIRYKGESLFYPVPLSSWKIFAFASAMLMSDSSEEISLLAEKSKTLYNYLVNMYRMFGGK